MTLLSLLFLGIIKIDDFTDGQSDKFMLQSINQFQLTRA